MANELALETWKHIPGYYGLYMVSSHGRVKSLERLIESRGFTKYVSERYIKQSKDKDGYLSVCLAKDGTKKMHRVHRLVAASFVYTSSGDIVNHKDCNPSNNFYQNLEWCDHAHNMRHSANLGRKVAKNRKLSTSDADCVRQIYASGSHTMSEIAETFGVTRTTIGYIINLKSYTK